jgi:hypothetical protein
VRCCTTSICSRADARDRARLAAARAPPDTNPPRQRRRSLAREAQSRRAHRPSKYKALSDTLRSSLALRADQS